MGGLNERTIGEKAGSEGRPRRRVGADAADGVTIGVTSPPGAALRDVGGAPLPVLSPARRLLAAVERAGRVAPSGETGAPAGLGEMEVRCHVTYDQQHVHFHAKDGSGLKAAVVKADVWSAFRRLQNLGTVTFIDGTNKTLLAIVVQMDADPNTGEDRVHLSMGLVPCDPIYSPQFDAFEALLAK